MDLYKLQKPFYSAVEKSADSTWNINSQFVQQTSANLNSFLTYTNYSKVLPEISGAKQGVYDAMMDPTGPFNFMPKHCQQISEYSSPLIAVVKQGNSIEKDMINQLNVFFQTQKQFAASQNQMNQTKINPMIGNFTIKLFDSKEELWSYIGNDYYGLDRMPAICFGFRVFENAKNNFEVELFFNDLTPVNYKSIPNQKKGAFITSQQSPLVQEFQLYTQEGFLLMQNWFANTILKKVTNTSTAQIAMIISPFKTADIIKDDFISILQNLLPLFLLLIYIPVLYRTVYRIVFEKVTRAKESMRMMGMGDFAYWFSWFSYYTVVNTILTTLVWICLMINVLNRKSAGFIWLFIWMYGQSLFGLIIIVQSLFSTPRSASIVTTIVYFGTSILSVLVNDDTASRASKIGVSVLFPTVTMALGVQPLVVNSFQSYGLTANNLSIQYQLFSVSDALGLFFFGGMIQLMFGFYLEYILPKKYGKRLHPCFFLMCCCRKNQRMNQTQCQDDEKDHESKYMNKDSYENVPIEIAQKEVQGKILKISDLTKTYENGFQAVNGINLKLYSDQIFVLLGHNGAGKTSTISILTGLYPQTNGSAELFGIDLFNDMKSIRQIMGVCPQHDVLFELLTTKEHLSFFYDLKGADPKLKKNEIKKLMKDVGIYDKRNALAYQLSGGNKRKLSVAIALCGNSKFVVLDEPTSGLDLQARRQLWNMLKEQKKDRIILLTTHYMDEADILGDRIGIMNNGKLLALGSSIFLKSKFGAGYNLIINKQNSDQAPHIIEYFIKNLGEKIKKQSEIQTEMTIQIPSEYSQYFGQFFQRFDQDLKKLKIIEYGLSISTLEEVFLKVGHMDDPFVNEPEGSEKEISKVKTVQNENHDNTFSNNLFAVLYQRFTNYRRNKKAIVNEVLIPAIIMIAGLGLTQIQPSWQSPSILQTPTRLPLPQQLLMNQVGFSDNQTIKNLAKNLPDQLVVDFDKTINATFNQYGDSVFYHGQNNSNTPPYQYGSYQIYEANTFTQNYKFISWVNLTSQDATELFPQFMYESILKVATNDSNFSFKLRSTPYPPTFLVKNRQKTAQTNTVILISAISYSMIITAVCSYLVVERVTGLKHLQVISGMQLKAYWIGNFIFDFFKMQVTIVTTIIFFYVFNLNLNAAWVTYFILPLGILPFTYVSSFIFSADSAAQTFTIFFHFFILAIGSIMIFFLRIIPSQQILGDQLNWVLKVVPTYLIGTSVLCDISCNTLSISRLSPNATGMQIPSDVWEKGNNSFDVFAMVLHFVFWSVQLIMIEKGFWKFCRFSPDKRIQTDDQIDSDVEKETNHTNNPQNQDMIRVNNFKKVYWIKAKGCCSLADKMVAVSNLNFSLTTGECFALLGVNGAGKSTTFKSLTQEVIPTKGTIKIANLDVQQDFEKIRKLIGYCPQQNLIFDDMTVQEHLKYFVMIKGIPKINRKFLVEEQINRLGLSQHRFKPAGTLSGGNKRKLCVALALIGNPPIIFLDEPSAGMDPESRRFMWKIIGEIAQKKSSAVVLTTHSMDEAEALSTKMGIMVKGGTFKCFGSAQHIKNKFGTGFVIEIKIKTLDESELNRVENEYYRQGFVDLSTLTIFDDQVKQKIMKSVENLQKNDTLRLIHSCINLNKSILELCNVFTNVELLENYGNYMRVRVQRLGKSIGFAFGIVESLKITCDVSEYSVSQTTLEQIFQNFADQSYSENVVKYSVQSKVYEDINYKILQID